MRVTVDVNDVVMWIALALSATFFAWWCLQRWLYWRHHARYHRMTATGEALDSLAQHYGYWRRPGETDKQLRSRIAATWRLP